MNPKKSKKSKWRSGWSRALSEPSDAPITLHRAPWEQPDAQQDGGDE